MEISFAVAARAIEDVALQEQTRLDMTHWHQIRGMCPPMPNEAMAAWRSRLAGLQLAAALLRAMSESEAAAGLRARDERLDEIARRLEKVAAAGPPEAIWPFWP